MYGEFFLLGGIILIIVAGWWFLSKVGLPREDEVH